MAKQTKIMGILNVTPDSFSDGGRFHGEDGDVDLGKVVGVAKQMIDEGAEILDIGGESTGPGSVEVSTAEELKRVVPAVWAVRTLLDEMGEDAAGVIISVDTWKSEVAEAAIEVGAGMVNDVTAGRGDERIFDVVAAAGVPMILAYSKDDTPRTSQEEVEYDDVMGTVKAFLKERIRVARARGVKEVILDPGMGAFVSGDPEPSYEIIDRVEELDDLGCEVLVGTSRKSFLGEDREHGTLATSVLLKGRVDFLRVHDVEGNLTVV